jgi:lysozyme family protein
MQERNETGAMSDVQMHGLTDSCISEQLFILDWYGMHGYKATFLETVLHPGRI